MQILVSPAPKWPSNPQGRTPRAAAQDCCKVGRLPHALSLHGMDSDSEPVTRSHVGGSPWVDPRAGSSAAPQARPGPMRPGLQVACQPEVEADIRTTAMARAVTTGGAGADRHWLELVA